MAAALHDTPREALRLRDTADSAGRCDQLAAFIADDSGHRLLECCCNDGRQRHYHRACTMRAFTHVACMHHGCTSGVSKIYRAPVIGTKLTRLTSYTRA